MKKVDFQEAVIKMLGVIAFKVGVEKEDLEFFDNEYNDYLKNNKNAKG